MSAPTPSESLPPGRAPRLVVDGLVVDRGGRRVLDGVGLTLGAGEALVVTGPNGAGKSTLLRAILGLVHAAAGRVRVEGETVAADDDAPGRFCHYLGHRDGVKTALTLAENLAFWRAYLGDDGHEDGTAIDAALAAVGLADIAHLPAAYLSAGQRRRLGIARLIAVRRPIWLLDEPTAALDAASETAFTALMNRHIAVGGAILAATHLPLGLAGARRIELGGPAGGARP